MADSDKRFVKPPKFVLPLTARIPPNWILSSDQDWICVSFPSWGTGKSPNGEDHYTISINSKTRQMFCNCLAFRFTKNCHHVRGLLWSLVKPNQHHSSGVLDTSIASFRAFTEEELADRHASVYRLMKDNLPRSNKEIAEALHWKINSVTPRVKELREAGVLAEAGYQFDEITQRHERLWKCVVEEGLAQATTPSS